MSDFLIGPDWVQSKIAAFGGDMVRMATALCNLARNVCHSA